jgi:hypothetical protein
VVLVAVAGQAKCHPTLQYESGLGPIQQKVLRKLLGFGEELIQKFITGAKVAPEGTFIDGQGVFSFGNHLTISDQPV